MRVNAVNFNGTDYLLCFSVRVSRACSERYGSVSAISEVLSSRSESECLDETVWLFLAMADAGRRYAQRNGLDVPPALSEDDVLDGMDVPGFARLVTQVKAAIAAGSAPEIETQPEGNAAATRE